MWCAWTLIRHWLVVRRRSGDLPSSFTTLLSRLCDTTTPYFSLPLLRPLFPLFTPSRWFAPRLFLSFIFIHCLSSRPVHPYPSFLSSSLSAQLRSTARAALCVSLSIARTFSLVALSLGDSLGGDTPSLVVCVARVPSSPFSPPGFARPLLLLPPPLLALSVSLFPPYALRFLLQPLGSSVWRLLRGATRRARRDRAAAAEHARARPC